MRTIAALLLCASLASAKPDRKPLVADPPLLAPVRFIAGEYNYGVMEQDGRHVRMESYWWSISGLFLTDGRLRLEWKSKAAGSKPLIAIYKFDPETTNLVGRWGHAEKDGELVGKTHPETLWRKKLTD